MLLIFCVADHDSFQCVNKESWGKKYHFLSKTDLTNVSFMNEAQYLVVVPKLFQQIVLYTFRRNENKDSLAFFWDFYSNSKLLQLCGVREGKTRQYTYLAILLDVENAPQNRSLWSTGNDNRSSEYEWYLLWKTMQKYSQSKLIHEKHSMVCYILHLFKLTFPTFCLL